MRRHRLVATLALAALAVAGTATHARAQLLQIRPKIGAFSPLTDLGQWDGNVHNLQGSFAIGLAAEMKLPILPRLRVGFDYATNSKLSVKNGLGPAGSGGTTMLALTGDLVFRKNTGIVRPYALVGAGIKRYNISESQLTSPTVVLDRSQSDFTGHLGAGLDFSLGLVGIGLEASDYISRFNVNGQNKLQHDLFVMAGVNLGLF